MARTLGRGDSARPDPRRDDRLDRELANPRDLRGDFFPLLGDRETEASASYFIEGVGCKLGMSGEAASVGSGFAMPLSDGTT
jgi:hypothetical protein